MTRRLNTVGRLRPRALLYPAVVALGIVLAFVFDLAVLR